MDVIGKSELVTVFTVSPAGCLTHIYAIEPQCRVKGPTDDQRLVNLKPLQKQGQLIVRHGPLGSTHSLEQ